MRKNIIQPLIFMIVITLTSCSLFQSEIDSVTDLLPRDSDVPGWARVDFPLYYKGKDVKKYNREYNGLEIEKIASSFYRSIDDPNVLIKLEVMRFDSLISAYGFFSIKRGPGIFETSNINEYYSNAISIIQIGEYVIYAITENTDFLLKKDLKTFCNIPLLYIGQNYQRESLPESIKILKGMDGYGVLYSGKPYHMFPFLRKIHFTQWLWNNEIINVFFTQNDSFYNSYEIFKKNTGNDYVLISSDNIYTAFKKETDEKYTFISVNDKWIFGCWSVGDFNEGKKVLSEIQSRIADYKKRGNK